jgi:hypothetical protein
MAITRTYSVGQNSKARRLDNHTLPWVDVSPTGDTWEIYDVMTDPNSSDKVTIVGEVLGGVGTEYGIKVSTNAGSSWLTPVLNNPNNEIIPTAWYELWYVDSNIIWIVGFDGAIAKSIDGAVSFTMMPQVNDIPIGASGIPLGNDAYTAAIHAINADVAVIVESRGLIVNTTVSKVWKTVNGGFSWQLQNGGLVLTTIGAGVIGYGEGVWISDDKSTIIAATSGSQNVSTDFGATFTSIPLEPMRSGRHLTWYPSYGDPDFFRHLGGEQQQVIESTDTGTTFILKRPLTPDSTVIRGGHFYSDYNGYYIEGKTIFWTTDGAVTGTISDIVLNTEKMNAVWTTAGSTIYRLIDCTGAQADIYSTSSLLAPVVGSVVTITGIFEPDILATCWQVEITFFLAPQLSLIGSVTSFDNCISCLPEPADDICWDLISCNGSCDDLLSVTGLTFLNPPIAGSLYTINGDFDCIYELYPIRQAMFINYQTDILSDPNGAFQLGTDDITIEISSIIYNNVEQVVTPFTYLLTPVNYEVVECTGLNCVTVQPNTTENCVDNTQLFLNNVLTSLDLPIEAYSDDPEHCGFDCGGPKNNPDEVGCKEMFRLQYRDGDTFTITFITANNSGTNTLLLEVQTGNLSLQTNLNNGTIVETCNADVYCPPVSQPLIQSIDFWDGDCIPATPPIQPEIGEACETKPRLGEPGFATKHCDPKKVVAIKTSYADSVFALFKRLRYGIETCCEYDLDKIDIKNMLLDLGDIYDPDLCIPGQPVPNGCCLQPCNVSTMLTLQVVPCPEPINVAVVLEIPVQCIAPTNPIVTILAKNCLNVIISGNDKTPGSFQGTDCSGNSVVYTGIDITDTIGPICIDFDLPTIEIKVSVITQGLC